MFANVPTHRVQAVRSRANNSRVMARYGDVTAPEGVSVGVLIVLLLSICVWTDIRRGYAQKKTEHTAKGRKDL
jgi:hypothetical protein